MKWKAISKNKTALKKIDGYSTSSLSTIKMSRGLDKKGILLTSSVAQLCNGHRGKRPIERKPGIFVAKLFARSSDTIHSHPSLQTACFAKCPTAVSIFHFNEGCAGLGACGIRIFAWERIVAFGTGLRNPFQGCLQDTYLLGPLAVSWKRLTKEKMAHTFLKPSYLSSLLFLV